MISVFEHPWLGRLLGDEEIAALWSPETQLTHFRTFEAALARALETVGMVAPGVGAAAARAIETAEIEIESLGRSTERDGVPIPDLVRQLRAAAGDWGPAVHTGATSQDVIDSALAMTLRDLTGVLIDRMSALIAALGDLRAAQGTSPLTARTRMQAASPITAGDRIDAWVRPLEAHSGR